MYGTYQISKLPTIYFLYIIWLQHLVHLFIAMLVHNSFVKSLYLNWRKKSEECFYKNSKIEKGKTGDDGRGMWRWDATESWHLDNPSLRIALPDTIVHELTAIMQRRHTSSAVNLLTIMARIWIWRAFSRTKTYDISVLNGREWKVE